MDKEESNRAILALKNAVKKHGIPEKVSIDTGKVMMSDNPPAVFQRMGPQLTSTIVKDARDKIRERNAAAQVNAK